MRNSAEHGQHRYIVCEHGHRRDYCKECGGRQICEHGRRRSRCKECKELSGKSICEHDGQKQWCKKCRARDRAVRAGRICKHNWMRHYCKECGGKGICEHGRRRTTCQDCTGCGGVGICEHGRRRSQCKVCRSGLICEHGTRRGTFNKRQLVDPMFVQQSSWVAAEPASGEEAEAEAEAHELGDQRGWVWSQVRELGLARVSLECTSTGSVFRYQDTTYKPGQLRLCARPLPSKGVWECAVFQRFWPPAHLRDWLPSGCFPRGERPSATPPTPPERCGGKRCMEGVHKRCSNHVAAGAAFFGPARRGRLSRPARLVRVDGVGQCAPLAP